MSEAIWLVSIAIGEFEEATPLSARRTIESAKKRCDEHRAMYTTDDYTIGPVTWGDERFGEVTGEAVITFTFQGKQETTKQIYVLEELNLED